ncbi:DUF4129 domain-containing protein [Mangrovimicrobium sediminis]|uniref:DUF4129 domain-containing protein n=1 Tax=Mangrovimicrobium sediminis TaxID=2562682 RepID=A0A4Z0M7Z2_9GAMM|nr:DUF4129 domain-containing protein [Haliea sp. SAOS-164]TGD75822.1 DUF4129 domain-containing protein [Haliea sp. SAOS-164]
MQLDELAIAVRQRSGWSAIDLGFTLTRLWWRALFLSWLLPAGLVFCVLHVVLYKYPQFAILLTWWLKPVFDRFPLYILSRRVFGEDTGLREALRQWREICRCDLLPWQLWRRFNPLRSFVMPVTVLERLQGKPRERRLRVLQLASGNQALWLTMICLHLETLMVFAAIMTGFLLLPAGESSQFISLAEAAAETETALLFNALSLLGMALVAPFYTAAGFTLYLNRRVELEGWDIEVSFRNLAQRLAATRSAAALLLVGVLAAGFLHAPQTLAEAPPPDPTQASAVAEVDAEVAREEIDAVLAGEAFHEVLVTTRWQWKHASEDDPEGSFPNWLILLVESLEKVWPDWDWPGFDQPLALLAWLLRFAVVVVLLALLLYVALRYRETIGRWTGRARTDAAPDAPPERLFGMAVTRESLPVDVPAEVAALWQAGEQRAAMALLYRGALSQLLHRFDIPFTHDLTERECAELVAARSPAPVAQFFGQMTRGWMRLAYGHVAPSGAWVDDLCRQWRELFGHE